MIIDYISRMYIEEKIELRKMEEKLRRKKGSKYIYTVKDQQSIFNQSVERIYMENDSRVE